MIPATPASFVAITGAEAACCLGNDLQAVRERVMSGEPGLRPLRELDAETRWPELRAGWIPDRELMRSRRYGPASALAVHLARRAVAQLGGGGACGCCGGVAAGRCRSGR